MGPPGRSKGSTGAPLGLLGHSKGSTGLHYGLLGALWASSGRLGVPLGIFSGSLGAPLGVYAAVNDTPGTLQGHHRDPPPIPRKFLLSLLVPPGTSRRPG